MAVFIVNSLHTGLGSQIPKLHGTMGVSWKAWVPTRAHHKSPYFSIASEQHCHPSRALQASIENIHMLRCTSSQKYNIVCANTNPLRLAMRVQNRPTEILQLEMGMLTCRVESNSLNKALQLAVRMHSFPCNYIPLLHTVVKSTRK